MVAVVPFDWQAHDTYFIVAHLHYVLIGGMVFPLFAAFYYWTAVYAAGTRCPSGSGAGCSASIFAGFNLAFFPMHVTGLARHAAPRLHLLGGPRLGRAQPRVDDRAPS